MDLEDLQPPPAMLGYGGADAAAAADARAAFAQPPSLDEAFADILSGLMNESLLPVSAIQELRRASAAATQAYREDASAMLHRAAHRLHMFELAAEQESQAASWLLLQMLYCSGDTPAGVYMGANDVGGRPTLRQMTANTVNSDSSLRRFAQVVMWLEALAAQKLSEAPGSRFAAHEALWRATQLSLGSSSSRLGGAPELDPDAPSRAQGPLLAEMDQQAEERLGQQLWALLRAGKLKEARQLCCQAGQAWRSLSLSAGGAWGPLPVGPAAKEASEALDGQAAVDDLAWEVEGGAAAGMVAWKWACVAAADTAANNGGSKWEAAVYGALCGHIRRMLPVCSSWEDEAWAYCRSWLTLQTDAELLSGGLELEEAGAGAQVMLGSTGEDTQIPLDILEGCVNLAAAGGYSHKPPSKERLAEGLAAMGGRWPLHRLAGDSDGPSLLTSDFSALADKLYSSSKPAVAAACRQQQHALQLQLMAEDWESLVLQLVAAARRAKEQLDRRARRRGRQRPHSLASRARTFSHSAVGGGGGGGADSDVDMEAGDDDTASLAGGWMESGGDDEAGAGGSSLSQQAAVDVLRFSAHWALALRALGLLVDPAALAAQAEADIAQASEPERAAVREQREQQEQDMARLQHELNVVIQAYTSHLADQPASLALVPAYMCHLRLVGRKALTRSLLANAMDAWGQDDARQQELYCHLASATAAWYARQQRVTAAALQDDADVALQGPSNGLYGDLRREELRLLLQHTLQQVTRDSSLSPADRCSYLRWLYYSFTAAAAAAAAQPDAGDEDGEQQQQLVWHNIWGDALSYTLVLAAQLALNPGFGGLGLVQLFSLVVPPSFAAAAAGAAAEAAAVPGGTLARPELQLQVQRQLLAMQFWAAYAGLDGRYEAWMADFESAPSADAVAGLAASGEQLVDGMLALAQEDALLLPATPQVVQLLRDAAQLAGAADPATAAGVEVGQLLAEPAFDAPGGLLLASPEDEEAQAAVGYSRLSLAVTVSRRQPGSSDDEFACFPTQPYLQLTAADAQQLQKQVTGFLQAATQATPDVSFSTRVAGPQDALAGSVVVELRSYAAPAAAGAADAGSAGLEASRQNARQQRAWQDMVTAAAQLLSASASSGSGSWEPLPRLALVHMASSLSTQLAICRCRTTSKLLRRSAKVLQALASLGHSSPQLLDALLAAAADAGPEGAELLEQLSPRDADKLLRRLQAILVDTAGDPVGAQDVGSQD